MQSVLLSVLATAAMLSTASLACPPEVYVDASAPPGGDGASWATAFIDLQDAVQCPDAKVIHVARGNYRPAPRESFVLRDGVTLLGGYPAGGGERDPDTYTTTLLGYRTGHEILVLVEDCNKEGVTLDGLTLTWVNSFNYYSGAAVESSNSSVTIRGCQFVDNVAANGAAVRSSGSKVTILDCHFENNMANGECYAVGGAIEASGTLTIRRSTFVNNHADEKGDCSKWTHAVGGAIRAAGETTILDCYFERNSAYAWGDSYAGAIALTGNAHAVILNSTFIDNSAPTHGGAIWAGWASDGMDITIANCIFYSNSTSYTGGAISFEGADRSRVANSTFMENHRESIQQWSGTPTVIVNCILRGGIEPPVQGEAIVNHSNIQGGYPGRGNIDVDPMLDADYRLLPGSPCIDAGTSSPIPGWLWGDFDRNPRKVDDPNTPNTGRGDPPIDMGAFEFQP